MTPETQANVDTLLNQWKYLQELPPEWHGYRMDTERHLYDDVYDFCRFIQTANHRQVVLYYHHETQEYKLRERLGSLEFCHIECIATALADFEILLRENLEKILSQHNAPSDDTMDSMIQKKKILDWNYSSLLPNEVEDFYLFIHPDQPLKITNGSYVIIDYENFNENNNFAIYYNIYRDDFFCEAHSKGMEKSYYQFDSNTLEELEDKLASNLSPCLAEIRKN